MQENLAAEVAEFTSKITAKIDAEFVQIEPEELKTKIADLTNDVAAFAI